MQLARTETPGFEGGAKSPQQGSRKTERWVLDGLRSVRSPMLAWLRFQALADQRVYSRTAYLEDKAIVRHLAHFMRWSLNCGLANRRCVPTGKRYRRRGNHLYYEIPVAFNHSTQRYLLPTIGGRSMTVGPF